jgi:hypothetical protein
MAASPTWTAPADWANGELVTDTKLNAQVRDNLQYLWQKGHRQGTSFPGSPAVYDRFFRTDLLFDCVYDGARWLTTNEYSASFTQGALSPYSATILAGEMVAPAYTAFVTQFAVRSAPVSGTHNSSNYWNIDWRYDGGVFSVFNTIGDSGVVVRRTTPNVACAGAMYIGWALTKIGTPSAIYISGSMQYRLVIT